MGEVLMVDVDFISKEHIDLGLVEMLLCGFPGFPLHTP